MAGRLAGETALITGGGRGFGRAIALGLAREGANVAVAARTMKQVKEVAREIEALGVKSLALEGDVTKGKDIKAMVKETGEELGPVTIMVNNAGRPGPFGPITEIDDDDWWDAQKLHILAPFRFMQAVLPGMQKRGKGVVINVASRGGLMVQGNLSAYCLGKAALIRLSELAARETRKSGVGVFSIQPGDAATGMAEETIGDPGAQKYLPGMVEVIQHWKETSDNEKVFADCARLCVELATGKHNALSGKYLEPDYDLEQMERELIPWNDRDTTILGGAKMPPVPKAPE